MVQSAVSHPMDELNKLNFFAAYNHIEPEFVEPDHAVFKLKIRPESKNPYGIVHGGAIYTMADNATGYAAHTEQRDAFSPQPDGRHRACGRARPSPWKNDLSCRCGYSGRGRKTPRHGGIHLFLH